MPITISYKYSTEGAEDVKKRLKELNAEYAAGKITVAEYGAGIRDIDRDTKSLVRTQNISKNLFLATHPALNKLSRGISAFGSVARTSLSIMNAFNLAQLTGVSVSSQKVAADEAVKNAQLEYNRAVKQFGPDSIEAAKALGDLNAAIAAQQELTTTEKQQGLNDFVTTISGLGTAIATTLQLLINNPKIATAIWNAASKMGALFGGVFTGASTAIMAAGSWIASALGIGSAAGKSSAAAGTRLGTVFGLSFAGAASVAIIAVGAAILAGALDIMLENVSGQSFVRQLTEKLLGKGNGLSTKDILGLNTHKGADISGQGIFGGPNSYEEYIKGFEGKKTDKAVKQEITFFQPLLDLFNKGLPEAYGVTDDKFQEVFVDNIPAGITNTAPVIREGFKSMWNGVIELTNAAGSGMVTATNSIFNSLINALNSMINAYNTAARKIGKPTVGKVTFSPIKYTPIPVIAAAKGFEGIVNQPTNFLVGEGGRPEHVAVTPLGKKGSGSGTTVIIQNYFSGSLLAERELARIQDKNLKDALLKVGFKKPLHS